VIRIKAIRAFFTSEVSDAVVIDEPKEHMPQLSQLEIRSTAPSYFPPCVDV
jgi:hypothetical protein